MLITLGFCLLYHRLQLRFVCCAHYTPFICGKGLLKILIFEKYFQFLEKIIPYLFNCECLLNLGSYYHLFFYHQNFVITIVLSLIFYKINHNLTQY